MSVGEYSGIPTTNLPNFLRNLQVQQQKTDTQNSPSHPDQPLNTIEFAESGTFERQRRSNSSGVLLLEVDEDQYPTSGRQELSDENVKEVNKSVKKQ